MGKMIKCKSCGSEIAKSAKFCPKCGARQHQVALSVCAIIVVLAIVLCSRILFRVDRAPTETNTTSPEESAPSLREDEIFNGENAKISFISAYSEPSVSGCFYISLGIENTSSIKEWVYLEDVSVDGLSCNSGSGVPVTVLPGEKSNGDFIIFYDGDFPAAKEIKLNIVIANDETMDSVEETGRITIELF